MKVRRSDCNSKIISTSPICEAPDLVIEKELAAGQVKRKNRFCFLATVAIKGFGKKKLSLVLFSS